MLLSNTSLKEIQKIWWKHRPGIKDAIHKGVCFHCSQPKGIFREPIDEQEYNISGLCQICADNALIEHVFGRNNDWGW
jgi:hypothetical protein